MLLLIIRESLTSRVSSGGNYKPTTYVEEFVPSYFDANSTSEHLQRSGEHAGLVKKSMILSLEGVDL